MPPRSALWLDWSGRRIGPMPLVTGFDTPFPYALEDDYLPLARRIVPALRETVGF